MPSAGAHAFATVVPLTNSNMKFIKQSRRLSPKVSLILADWSVRESFHLLHYLAQQTVPRDQFEVIVIEYYDRVSEAVRKFEHEVDTWMLLEMPAACYYHKHLIYNAGIVVARGDIIVIVDSDAMVKPSFIEAILSNFGRDPNIVYHIDQFRNTRTDLYPFQYPSVEEVLGAGCINNAGGKTAGIVDQDDPLHSRNYGACMCARRSDLISIGGADMDIDYLGHICGPYEMTFRLTNIGRPEVWDQNEFMYHTWHPGQAGVDNFLGPHHRHMSLTAFEALASRRWFPLLENGAIAALRTGQASSADVALGALIAPDYLRDWDIHSLRTDPRADINEVHSRPTTIYKGFALRSKGGQVTGLPLELRDVAPVVSTSAPKIECKSFAEVRRRIDAITPRRLSVVSGMAHTYAFILRLYEFLRCRGSRLLKQQWLSIALTILLSLPVLPFVLLIQPNRLGGRVGRVLQDVQESSEVLGNTAAVLDRLLSAHTGMRNAGKIVLVVDKGWLMFFKMLIVLRFLPNCELCAADSLNNASGIAIKLHGSSWSGLVVIPRNFYSQFYYSSRRHAFGGRAVIV